MQQTPPLEVVHRRRMGELRRHYTAAAQDQIPESTGDLSMHLLGYCVTRNGRSTIYVESGLPYPLLLGTLAHELGHAWQAEHAPQVRDLPTCEGFAEWVAHSVLVAAGYQMLAARATRRDDLYGRSLRQFLRLEQRGGKARVLAAALGR